MTYKIIIFLFVLSTSIVVKSCFFIGKTQSVKARGQVFCNSVPYKNVIVKLMEEEFFTSNDFLNGTYTDGDGYFSVRGACREIRSIDPFLEIHHRCGVMPSNCFHLLKIYIPSNFIYSGPKSRVWFDIGIINLKPTYKTYKNYYCRR
ncbi:Transthyretin-like family-containing protein [Strongyloides ratti]|uniref:Transthyretin-like family-containing protein n=1 Tax=Strongyloides ratti TaxID=34506 RepID=A0A090N063_STRRB|nr:Transthyretin-like family-containing protein [Strongyloides ratti]CEF70135.1 Transthyretin-like family-containing protein [Strongyloides ratti]